MNERFTFPHADARRRTAFTLVELLVVIGIIALLISILLPTLTRARASAQGVVRASNLRSTLQGMLLYVNASDGYLPGSAWTSGRHLYDPGMNNSNCPLVSHINDWQAPIARMNGVEFNEGADIDSRRERFAQLM